MWKLGVLLLLLSPGSHSQRTHPCDQSSCYPATGNLLIGRESRLSATSTCGLHHKERFCIVSHLEDRKKCFWCDASSDKGKYNHKIGNIVSRTKPITREATWWQSANGVENVSIRLDLEAEFHLTHLIITFKTFRPAAMLIERSYDFGHTWKVYRYFAHNCGSSFPGIPTHPPTKITDVICESQYSNVAPSTEGEVIFRVLTPNLPVYDPYSDEVQNLLKVTNLRINFTKLHTLGDDLLDNRQEIKEKYYYAIYNMVVRGSCSCYGHASRCLPLSEDVSPRPDMVHGRCECTHNTKGFNCEQCRDFFNDLPWRPAIGRQTNECQKCNCNNHADSCHFDSAVYEATGRVSGGICDGCQHNTMGRNCEQCKPFFYRNRDLPLDHVHVCAACDCDPRGSLGNGICDAIDDPSNGLMAGQCHCKRNIGGPRCDSCLPGFFNFNEENPDGCEPCICNSLGTNPGQGCDSWTGECICKPFVTGRDCSRCLPQHYGLSSDKDGCKPCDCDLGGSYGNDCDVVTGQCRCRSHVTGRRCDKPSQGYFAGALDYLIYEAELARSSPDSQLVIREPYQDGRETTWTGLGFQRIHPGSWLEFDIDEIFQTMDYDVVLRYSPTRGTSFPNTRVTLQRKQLPTPGGLCAQSDDSHRYITLHSDGYYAVAESPLCLEEGHQYKIRVDFREFHSPDETKPSSPKASVLIDSVVLVPKLKDAPVFPATNLQEREEFDRYRCSELYFGLPSNHAIPEVCQKYLHSIGFYVYGEGKDCACDPTGSLSSICETYGGQCPCKPHVSGRRCDRCDPGTYGFGPQGCVPCDCNPVGSLDNLCDAQTGQCRCRTNRNTYGRQCDHCQPGFWDFPTCRRCECHGHADSCEPTTGSCLLCRDATSGEHCDVCLDGYYGDPRLGVDIPCRHCPCPGTMDSGHSFATQCALNPLTQGVVCQCVVGYAGDRCQLCADNYYGNPEQPGGSCRSCDCNNNIDLSSPGNCDPHTGACLRCLYNTEGPHCDQCRDGYYGDPINQGCIQCVCNLLGTDDKKGPCDKLTGQCPCQPNVMGVECDHCAENHWKLASGEGCEACDCDPVGSQSDSCNEYDGQCSCLPGFGGRKCDECLARHWGDPRIECFPCQCDAEGSDSLQCDRNTGNCPCLTGIGGARCDQCARGYEGEAPYCQKCPECFWNWDRILNEIRERTQQLVDKAAHVQQVGVTGGYTEQFDRLEKKLGEIDAVLGNASVPEDKVNAVAETIRQLTDELEDVVSEVSFVDSTLANLTERSYLANLALEDLRNEARELQEDAKKLKASAAKLQEANVEGALNLTREARGRTEAAQKRVDLTYKTLGDASTQRSRAQSLLEQQNLETDRLDPARIEDISGRLAAIETALPDINELVCDKRGNPCDPMCGGAGCSQCGGLSCNEGAVTRSASALDLAMEAKDLLEQKSAALDTSLQAMKRAKLDAEAAERTVQEALGAALSVHNGSARLLEQMQSTNKRIEDFLIENRASPGEIRRVAEEVLGMSVSLDENQIAQLAKEIQEATGAITNIDQILLDTASDQNEATKLKARAEEAKKYAESVLNDTESVLLSLQEADEAQQAALMATERAGQDIRDAHDFLSKVDVKTVDAHGTANQSFAKLELLDDRMQELRKLNTKVNNDLRDAGKLANESEALAASVRQDADRLKEYHDDLTTKLSGTVFNADDVQSRASRVKERASQLSARITSEMIKLEEMETEYVDREQKLRNLSDELLRLNEALDNHLSYISLKAEYYRTCNK